MRWLTVLVAAGWAGCDGGGDAAGTGETGETDGVTGTDSEATSATTPGACVSGEEWTRGDMESPLMHPGLDCIECHAARRGPPFVIAGTVFSAYHEPDDCNGRSGITVEITDANGDVFEAQTNSAGNFYLNPFQASIALPYTARILVNGTETNAMAGAQSDGACNHCHTEDGAQSAPGRIVVGD